MLVEVIPLQEGISNATLTAYIQEQSLQTQVDRPAVIICPGGAYLGITEKEAEPVALRFLAEGYHAFILRYSIGTGEGLFPAPLIDIARSILLVRENENSWGIQGNSIFLCGFSAGGHAAAIYAATWHEGLLEKELKREKSLFRPNGLLLGYPLLNLYGFSLKHRNKSMELDMMLDMMFTAILGTPRPEDELLAKWSVINKISNQMPPTFLWTTSEDILISIEDTLDFVKSLATSQVPYELHILEKGPHGLSLGDHTVGYSQNEVDKLGNSAQWMKLALKWLKLQQYSTN